MQILGIGWLYDGEVVAQIKKKAIVLASGDEVALDDVLIELCSEPK